MNRRSERVEFSGSQGALLAARLDLPETPGQVDRIERIIRFDGDLDDMQRQRLREIVDRCLVHRTLRSEIVIDTTVSDAGRGPAAVADDSGVGVWS